MNTFAAGGFRTAFDQLNAVSAVLDEVEDTIASIEIDVSTRIADDAPPPAPAL